MLIRRCEIEGALRDVRVRGERVTEVAARLEPEPGENVCEAAGGALLPGLNDHHMHLFAAAAALRSVRCGPPQVRDARQLEQALASAPGGGWLRGVGYHECVAGALDRAALDRWLPKRPARVQHRTGALWVLNSAALAELGLDAGVDAPGVERNGSGRATGRLFRLDAWLGEQLDRLGERLGSDPNRSLRRERVSLCALSLHLARCGVTAVTDTGADNGAAQLAAFAAAQRSGELLQRVHVFGDEHLPIASGPLLSSGALKIVLDERELPELPAVAARIAAAHEAGRRVALHAVTRVELMFALAALADAGTLPGDRVEHASVAPPEAVAALRELELTVVTQPSFVAERGDQYARDVEPADRPWLYRARGLLAAGVRLAAGSDAPYSEPDPWRAMRAAVERRSESGIRLGSAEALTPEEALGLFTTPLDAPGHPPPRIAPATAADLCLLRAPWSVARRELSSDLVAATWRTGELIWQSAAHR